MGGFDIQRGAPGEISALAPTVSMRISNRNQIWDGRHTVLVDLQETICGGRNIENVIESTCFNLKSSQGHVFCSNLS